MLSRTQNPENPQQKITRVVFLFVFFTFFLLGHFFLFFSGAPRWLVQEVSSPGPPLQAPGRRVACLVVFRRLALHHQPLGWFQCLWMAPVPRCHPEVHGRGEGGKGCWVEGRRVRGVFVGVCWGLGVDFFWMVVSWMMDGYVWERVESCHIFF